MSKTNNCPNFTKFISDYSNKRAAIEEALGKIQNPVLSAFINSANNNLAEPLDTKALHAMWQAPPEQGLKGLETLAKKTKETIDQSPQEFPETRLEKLKNKVLELSRDAQNLSQVNIGYILSDLSDSTFELNMFNRENATSETESEAARHAISEMTFLTLDHFFRFLPEKQQDAIIERFVDLEASKRSGYTNKDTVRIAKAINKAAHGKDNLFARPYAMATAAEFTKRPANNDKVGAINYIKSLKAEERVKVLHEIVSKATAVLDFAKIGGSARKLLTASKK